MIIPYQKFEFLLEAIEPIRVPPYKGSTLRGGFGNVFRRVVCVIKRNECDECLLKERCIYAYIFETYPQHDAGIMNMSKYEKIPHPFIIEPPDDRDTIYEEGRIFSFYLTLIGNATSYLPYFIYTFIEMGKTGIGKFNNGNRGRFELLAVKSENNIVYSSNTNSIKITTVPSTVEISEEFNFSGETSSNSGQSITLEFLTPVRLSFQRDLVVVPEFHIVIRSILRRLSLLYYFHAEKRLPTWNHREIIEKAHSIEIKDNKLKWHDWERYSSRQNIRMKLGGLMGNITYSGNIYPFMQFLKAGEIFHIGKGTSFGLGKYRISDF
ncbi:CRISPR system precrRNA processing endoribonuclease RAMP protein Cas6 [Thermodesulfovibrio thiophilus]|uniref:CRISPR system precrRNA processing endoribonuclease RAMP protein Cas6 n=1 Tax=Thermodesulfovibrio thiophilus TaxID=340095 RepID=UPI0017D30CE3|nr:CRISPR system precrRNA processing endoribonuclease RAMP protein Cas6 [Thermodesulfovibrio thiophilus]HHW20441.1 CRISPR system precrRNA processing endoribonuclease RAMP protein Cas6 [Thermodesulfovibrio thiophilus]